MFSSSFFFFLFMYVKCTFNVKCTFYFYFQYHNKKKNPSFLFFFNSISIFARSENNQPCDLCHVSLLEVGNYKLQPRVERSIWDLCKGRVPNERLVQVHSEVFAAAASSALRSALCIRLEVVCDGGLRNVAAGSS